MKGRIFTLLLVFLSIAFANSLYGQKSKKRPFECGVHFTSLKELRVDPKVKSYLQHGNFKAGDIIADVGTENGYLPLIISIFHDSLNFFLQDINERCLNPLEFKQVHNYYSVLHAKEIGNSFEFIIGEQNDTRLPKATFDKIMMNDVVHQLYEPFVFFEGMKACLKHDGLLYIGQYEYNGLSTNAIIYFAAKTGFRLVERNKIDNYHLFIFAQGDHELVHHDDLHLAAIEGDLSSIKRIMNSVVAVVDPLDEIGFTPLMYAAKYGQLDVMNYLLENGADVNALGRRYPITALQLAVVNNHEAASRILIEKGASVNARFKNVSILMSAVGNANIDLTNLLLNNGADKRYRYKKKGLGFYAVTSDNLDMIKYASRLGLIKQGMKDSDRRTLLFYAASGNCLDCVVYMMEYLDFKTSVKDKWGCTPVCYIWSEEIKEYFLKSAW